MMNKDDYIVVDEDAIKNHGNIFSKRNKKDSLEEEDDDN